MADKVKKIIKDNQGTVLLLALLMMASIVVAGIGMGHIIINQLRQAILVDNSVTAYYAADAAIESSLYKIRGLGMDLPSLPTTGTLDNGAEWTLDWSYSRPDINTSILENRTYQVDIFDPDDLSWNPGIEALKFSWDGPGQLEIAYISWTPAPSIAWPQQDYEVVTPPISFIPPAIIYNAVSGTKAYRIRLRAVNGDITNLNITGWSDDAATPGNQVELPSHITLEAIGKIGRARQALGASIPRFAQLSGIWDFVLFSEQPITKE